MAAKFNYGTKCEFESWDVAALKKILDMVICEGAMIAEVGCWVGTSTTTLARAALSCNGKIFAVDHWQGSPPLQPVDFLRKNDVYSIFRSNLTELGLWDVVNPLVMSSQTASSIFADEILDMVFIDADHRYDYISADLQYWFPKLKKGGILCGHDGETYYSKLPQEVKEVIDEHKNEDFVLNRYHPGVIRALYDRFRDGYSIIGDSSVWWLRKGISE